MPKNQVDRTIDRPYSTRTAGGSISVTGGGGGTPSGVTDHGLLTGLGDDDHTQYLNTVRGDARYLLSARTLTAGAGLTGGGDLSADRTFAVGAGLGITVNADDVALASSVAGAGLTYTGGVLAVGAGSGLTVNADDVALTTPGTLTAATTNSATGSHTHAITASADVSGDGAGVNTLLKSSAGSTRFASIYAAAIYTAAGNLTLAPAGDIVLDPTGDDVLLTSAARLGTDNYASQVTGWRVDYAGAADFRYLYTDELHAKAFIADLEQALAGGQIIPKSVSLLSRAFTIPAAGAAATLYVRDLPSAENMAVFEAGDIVRLRQFSRAAGSLTIADAWGVVTAYADLANKEQSWTFTRSSAPNAGTASGTIGADSIVLDYGTSGNGLHEVNAIDGAYGINSPYSQVVTWTTHPATGSAVRVRTGNLRGITGSTEYGLWAGKTDGANLLTTGDKVALRQSTTEVITLDAAGNSYFAGVMTIGASGEIRQGTGTAGTTGTWPSPGTAWGTYTGTRLGRDSSGKGRIGGYLSGATQWEADTNGRLMAGNGKAWLDAKGLGILTPSGSLDYTNAVTWWTAVNDTERAAVGAWTVTGGTELGLRVGTAHATLDHNTRFNVRTGAAVGFSVLGTSYANVVGSLGVGVAYDTTPSAKLHVYGASATVRVGGTVADQNLTLAFYDADTTLKGRLLYAGGNGTGNKYFGFINDAADDLRFFVPGPTEGMRLNGNGLGIGGAAGTNEKLRVSGGTGITFVKIDSAHPNYGPVLQLAATDTGGRTYGIRSSQSSGGTGDTGGEGLFQIVDYTASAVRWTLDSSGNVTNAGLLTANGGIVLAQDKGILFNEWQSGTTPAQPTQNTQIIMYMKNNKVVFQFYGGNPVDDYYLSFDMGATSPTWSYGTSAP